MSRLTEPSRFSLNISRALEGGYTVHEGGVEFPVRCIFAGDATQVLAYLEERMEAEEAEAEAREKVRR